MIFRAATSPIECIALNGINNILFSYTNLLVDIFLVGGGAGGGCGYNFTTDTTYYHHGGGGGGGYTKTSKNYQINHSQLMNH